VTKFGKLIKLVLEGTSDNNISFSELSGLLIKLGFEHRIKGSHHIYFKSGLEEIINIQPDSKNMAKPYQVKQVRELIIRHKLVQLL
jgi:predicted RNA binding protein YcfA (HicA-like mRNA interferase family)